MRLVLARPSRPSMVGRRSETYEQAAGVRARRRPQVILLPCGASAQVCWTLCGLAPAAYLFNHSEIVRFPGHASRRRSVMITA